MPRRSVLLFAAACVAMNLNATARLKRSDGSLPDGALTAAHLGFDIFQLSALLALTGTPQQVRAAADAYRAMYSKVGEGEGYTMSHSLVIYLMGPDGRFRGSLAHDIGPVRGAEIIERHMARG